MVEDGGSLKGTYREVAVVNPDEDERPLSPSSLAARDSPETRRVTRGLTATTSAAV